MLCDQGGTKGWKYKSREGCLKKETKNVACLKFVLPVTSSGKAGLAVAMPTRFATEFTVSVFESIVTFPVTFSEDKFPTLVMLGWAAVWIVPSRKVPDSLVPLTFPAATFPVTFREDRVPTLVMLGWALVANVPASDVAMMFPLAVRFVTLKFPEMSSAP